MGIVCKCVCKLDKVVNPAHLNKRFAAVFLRNHPLIIGINIKQHEQ